ncbi:conserved hypothetical protein [Candidatus Magnetomoraceae bacterium gMMP-15]
MKYQVIISPNINISANDFISEWNQADECQKIAQAQLTKTEPVTFMDTSMIIGFVGGIITTVATDVLSNILTKLVENLLLKKNQARDFEIIPFEQKNGECFFVIKEKE